jgi:hypothetical protein
VHLHDRRVELGGERGRARRPEGADGDDDLVGEA